MGELVLSALDSLPDAEPLDPRLAQRAAAGRTADAVITCLNAVAERPRQASSTLREAQRSWRHLHSAERRLAMDAVLDGLRFGALLDDLVDVPSGWPGRYARWLAHRGGPSVDGQRSMAPPLGRLGRLARYLNVEPRLAEAFVATFGERSEAVAIAMQQRAAICLRAHGVTRDVVAAMLEAEQVPTRPGRWHPSVLQVVGRAQLEATQAFRQGCFDVVDEASAVVAGLVPEGAFVLDLCAGAGGKALAMADRGCRVVATDVRSGPLRRLEERAARLKAAVEVAARSEVRRGYDVVLVDAPCTGTGTWRRHPERRAFVDDLDGLLPLQRSLLDEAFERVRPGGQVIYATCSWLAVENDLGHRSKQQMQVGRAYACEGPHLQLDPDRHGTDALFAAVLQAR